MKTIIAAFRDQAAADQAIAFLQSRGVSDIEVMSGESLGDTTLRKLRDLGVPEERAPLYEDIMQRGAPIVAAHADHDAEELAMELDRLGSLDLDHVGARDTETSISTEDIRSAEGDARRSADIDVIEEEVQVGTRPVERGGVRVRTYVAERPIREDVELTEERIDITRERVDEPISAAAVDSTLTEDEFVVTARGEEVVVGKEARVVERVHVGKTAETRTETVEETERRRDVEVEPLETTDEGIGRPHR